jgi:hypothetical protein
MTSSGRSSRGGLNRPCAPAAVRLSRHCFRSCRHKVQIANDLGTRARSLPPSEGGSWARMTPWTSIASGAPSRHTWSTPSGNPWTSIPALSPSCGAREGHAGFVVVFRRVPDRTSAKSHRGARTDDRTRGDGSPPTRDLIARPEAIRGAALHSGPSHPQPEGGAAVY